MTAEYEKKLSLAIQALSSDYSSIRKAAADYGVSYTTLRRRFKGLSTSQTESHEHQQKLSCAQEEMLTEWTIALDTQGRPPSYSRVQNTALRILHKSINSPYIEQKWIRNFYKRNSRITSLLGVKIDTKRIDGTQYEIMRAFYDRFVDTVKRFKVQPEHIWNMDETGCQVDKGTNGGVLEKNHGKK
ncbi:Helix-turn-helix, Psq [Ascosphaera apis ARSEF 7405]|uniref:Helix-turn-helix, Psq n=1 Tax=Ascosphaera apis ARSEF 7405 TaxID=392613 RepID=A0A168AA11_9EURO|nr:Helix-turn-helix, Psq [Ascosphaera apis ARSEF 7405]